MGAGLIAGLVLMIVPRASPWSSLSFFAPVIMGRVVPEDAGMPTLISKTVHILLALGYGTIISLLVSRITQLWAVLAGAGVGLVLYLANYLVVNAWFPALRGDEPTIAFSHLVFGGIAGGAYRGLLWRRTEPQIEAT